MFGSIFIASDVIIEKILCQGQIFFLDFSFFLLDRLVISDMVLTFCLKLFFSKLLFPKAGQWEHQLGT